jgi:peroxiredoxin family protein
MTSRTTERDRSPPDKLSIVVFSGGYDKVHYALAMASAAAAVDRPVTLFFTMEAIRALLAKGAPDWSAEETANREKGVATMGELMDACGQLGVAFLVCTMGLKSLGVAARELRRDLAIAEGGIVAFLNDASGSGATLFI